MTIIDTIQEWIIECQDCRDEFDTRKTAVEIYALVASDIINKREIKPEGLCPKCGANKVNYKEVMHEECCKVGLEKERI